MKLDGIYRIIYDYNHCEDRICSKCAAGEHDYCYLLSVYLDEVMEAFADVIKKELSNQADERKRDEKRKDPV